MNDRILEAIKTLKENQDKLKKDLESNQRMFNEQIRRYNDSIKLIQKEVEKTNDSNLQKLMINIADDLGRYSIIDGVWYYNGKSLGVVAEAKDGKDGKPGKDGAQGPKGEDGETPVIKIGKVETSDEFGGAQAKLRKIKNKNEYLLDLVLPRGPQGFMGFDATINGKSSIEILSGNNISVIQEGKKVFINSLVNPFELKIVKELPTEDISSSLSLIHI